jgi:flagellar biosynthesis/type III secretory pathway chaperone
MEIKKLVEEITVETGLLEELLKVFERETAEMAKIDLTAMALSNEQKEELIARINVHSSSLLSAISRLALREGLPESTSLAALSEFVAKKGNTELLSKQQNIRRTTERLQQVAALNREIAERFASNVTTSLALITRLINQSNVYGASGGYQQRSAGAVMINREA